tara:strand:+ start:824 stop:1069 length:246 start_codon:yes stop_codon:yes gene_type:complete
MSKIKFKKEHLESYSEIINNEISELECAMCNEALIPFIEETLIPLGYNDENNYTLDGVDGIQEFFIQAQRYMLKQNLKSMK